MKIAVNGRAREVIIEPALASFEELLFSITLYLVTGS
jgi:hypothetical protein